MYVLKRKHKNTGHYNRVKDNFYRSKQWVQFRKFYFERHPFCSDCEAEGKLHIPGVVLDHIHQRSKGGADFPDDSGLRGLCVHHDAVRQRQQSLESRAI